MMLVKTELRPSGIHGLGCFTIEDIQKGQALWVFDPRVDIRFNVEELEQLPPAARAFIETYGFEELVDGRHVVTLCGDHGKFVNHSLAPNTVSSDDNLLTVAAAEIRSGEEITSNYFHYDLAAAKKLPRAFQQSQ